MIPLKVYQKMIAMTMAADCEISSMGLVHLEGDQEIWVDSIHFLKTEGSSAATVLDPSSVSKLMIDLIKKKINTNRLKLWFHTHYNFNVFWSGTDDNTAKVQLQNSKWNLSIVMNQAHEMLCRIDIYQPEYEMFNHIPVYLVLDMPEVEWQEYKTRVDRTLSKGHHRMFMDDERSDDADDLRNYMRSKGMIFNRDDLSDREKELRKSQQEETKELPSIRSWAPDNDSSKKIHTSFTCQCGVQMTVDCSYEAFICISCNRSWQRPWNDSGHPFPLIQSDIEKTDEIMGEIQELIEIINFRKEIEVRYGSSRVGSLPRFFQHPQFNLNFFEEISELMIEDPILMPYTEKIEDDYLIFLTVASGHAVYFDPLTSGFLFFPTFTKVSVNEMPFKEYLDDPKKFIMLANHGGTFYTEDDKQGWKNAYYYSLYSGIVYASIKNATMQRYFDQKSGKNHNYLENLIGRHLRNIVGAFVRSRFTPDLKKESVKIIDVTPNKEQGGIKKSEDYLRSKLNSFPSLPPVLPKNEKEDERDIRNFGMFDDDDDFWTGKRYPWDRDQIYQGHGHSYFGFNSKPARTLKDVKISL